MNAALSAILTQPLLNLRSLDIYVHQIIPRNHSFRKNQHHDPTCPNSNVLNLALRKLAERAPLTKLRLEGQWLLSRHYLKGILSSPI